MGYQLTLEKAGAKIIAFNEFGSYQGTWGAIVEYNGKKGLVIGSFGSCSYCDAFQSEFDSYGDTVNFDEKLGKYFKGWYYDEDNEITKEEYDKSIAELNERYADFGRTYLHTIADKSDVENRLKGFITDDWFNDEEKQLYTWALTYLN